MDVDDSRDMDVDDDNRNTTHTPQNDSSYVLSRTITTVHELWKEWDEGLYRGTPAVRDLEERYQASWRSSVKGRP